MMSYLLPLIPLIGSAVGVIRDHNAFMDEFGPFNGAEGFFRAQGGHLKQESGAVTPTFVTALPTSKPNPLSTQSAVYSGQPVTIDPDTLIGDRIINPQADSSVDLFKAVATDEPLSVFQRGENPLQTGPDVSNKGPFQTNKFFTNLIVGKQDQAVFTYPYSFWKYSQGNTHGLAVGHTNKDQYSFSLPDSNHNYKVFANPLGLAQLVFFADGLNQDFTTAVNEMTLSSVAVTLSNNNDSKNYLKIPLVQGMGFATGIYHGNLKAQLGTGNGNGITSFEKQNSNDLADGVTKYKAVLKNKVTWLVYASVPQGNQDFSLSNNNGVIEGSKSVDGLILQAAIAPSDTSQESYYDKAAGLYVTSFELNGSSDGNTANYEFKYNTQGKSSSGNTIIFTLPHHQELLDSDVRKANTSITLQSTTKGTMIGFATNSLKFNATLNKQISWLPWTSQLGGKQLKYSEDQLKLLAQVANSELNVSISDTINGQNTYSIGKLLDKYAYILLTVSDIIKDKKVTQNTLKNLQSAFDILFKNKQHFPLKYDTKFSGIVSSGDWNNDNTGYDYGNTYYNDHHFHYGYLVHAAAVVGYVDKKLGGNWAETNKGWVNDLVRDVANPSTQDSHFAQSRMFDWFHGHSWAAGLTEAGNGKNEESTSEDYNFAYGMKLWGNVIGDKSMEFRADLIISISKASINDYIYFHDGNDIQPKQILGNKVAGIIFDAVIDYATYFGLNTEYKHGIHMLPITPVSSEIREEDFVQQEWKQKLQPIIGNLHSTWGGLLRLNQALFDPKSSYQFFSQDNFDSKTYLDNGMSRTWSLAFSGGIANSLGQL